MPWLASIKWITARVDVPSGVRPPVMGYRGQPGQAKGTCADSISARSLQQSKKWWWSVPAVHAALGWNDEEKKTLWKNFWWVAQGQGFYRDESLFSFSRPEAWGSCSCRLSPLFHQKCGAVGNTDLSHPLYQLHARQEYRIGIRKIYFAV